MEELEVLRSSATIGLTAGRRLGLQQDLEDNIADVEAAFSTAMANTLGTSADNVVVEDSTVTAATDGSLSLLVNFYVVVEAGETGIGGKSMADLLSDFASGDSSLTEGLTAAFGTALDAVAGVDVTVGAVTITAPQQATIFVAEPTPAPTPEPAATGGGGAVVIVVVVLVVLAVVGLVVWKFVLKK